MLLFALCCLINRIELLPERLEVREKALGASRGRRFVLLMASVKNVIKMSSSRK